MLQEHTFSESSAMMEALRSALCSQLQHDLQHNEQVSLFLSGGSTPIPLYQKLAATSLPWQRVKVALVDERFVLVTDESSNEKLLRETLLREQAALVGFTGMSVAAFNEQRDLSTTVQLCNENYAQLPHPYSAAVLGMGADGHTASLFPHAEGVEQAFTIQRHCVGIRAQRSLITGTATERISMTPWALLQCQRLYLLFTGNEKKTIYERAKITSDQRSLPIAFFLQQKKIPVEVFWCP
jgi:6-phosphogluconolactonase